MIALLRRRVSLGSVRSKLVEIASPESRSELDEGHGDYLSASKGEDQLSEERKHRHQASSVALSIKWGSAARRLVINRRQRVSFASA